MPHNRYLSDKLWELRFRCGQVNQRITYTADQKRRIVTLTTFRKQRDNERAEIDIREYASHRATDAGQIAADLLAIATGHPDAVRRLSPDREVLPLAM